VQVEASGKGFTLKYRSSSHFINATHYHKLEKLFAR
jgi:hypothetical protein